MIGGSVATVAYKIGATSKPATNATRHVKSGNAGRSSPPTMPLIPATRPFKSASIAAAMPMMTPPVSADHGVNEVQSIVMCVQAFQVSADHSISRKYRLHAEVRAPNVRLRSQFPWRALGNDASFFEHVRAARDVERHGDVLFDQQNRDALGVDVANDPKHVEHYRRRQSERWLIEQEQARLRHQRPRDGHHLVLAARERAGGILQL